MAKANFTTINHVARKALGISMNEYAVCDMVYHLSNNPTSYVPGWCFASKPYIGELLDLSEKSIHEIVGRLIEQKLIEKHPETKYLKTTSRWYNTVIIKDTNETSVAHTKLQSDTNETSATTNETSVVAHETSVNIYSNNNSNNNSLVPYGAPGAQDKGEHIQGANPNPTRPPIRQGNPADFAQPMRQPRTAKTPANVELIINEDSNNLNHLIGLFREVNPLNYESFYKIKAQREALQAIVDFLGYQNTEILIRQLPEINQQKYVPRSTTPLELKKNFARYKYKHQDNSKRKIF